MALAQLGMSCQTLMLSLSLRLTPRQLQSHLHQQHQQQGHQGASHRATRAASAAILPPQAAELAQRSTMFRLRCACRGADEPDFMSEPPHGSEV